MRILSFFSLLLLLSTGLYASGDLYNQSENLDRGIEIIEGGVDLFKLNEGYNPEKFAGLKRVAEHAQNIFKELGDQDILKTQKGEYFKKRYKHLLNYISVAETFNECLKGDEEKKVSLKIMNALEGKANEVNVSCKDLNFNQNTTFDDFYANVLSIADKAKTETVFTDLSNQSLKNYARTYANFNYSLNRNSSLDPESVVLEICQNQCDDKLKEDLSNVVQREYQTLAASRAPRYNTEQLHSELVEKVQNINQTIDSLNGEVTTRERSLWWDAMDEGENFGPKYSHYLATFMKNVNEGPGVLILTETMKNAIGTPRLKDDYEKNGDDKYEFPKHKVPVKSAVSEAKAEVFDNLKKQFKKVHGKQRNLDKTSDNEIEESLEELVVTNPIAAAEVLNNHPEYAGHLCEPLNEIGSNQRFNNKLDNVMLIGGAVLGLGLMATGVGALVGGWLLAGTATAATLATVGTAAGIAGFSLGVAEGGYWVTRMNQHKHNVNVFETSVLAGSTDEKSYQEAADTIAKFRQARFDMILSFGFSAVEALTMVNEVGRLSRYFRNADALGDLSAAEKQGAMKKVSEIFEHIGKNEKLIVAMNRLKRIMGAERFGKFIASLASLSNRARVGILKNLSEMNPNMFKGDIDVALVDALNKAIKSGDLTLDEAKGLRSYYGSENIADLTLDPRTNQFAARLNLDTPEGVKAVDDVQLSTGSRVEIETDSDFNFYLSQMSPEDKEFTMKFIQLNRGKNVPKEDILDKLQNSVGRCNL